MVLEQLLLRRRKSSHRSTRKAGDAARDRKDWTLAAREYSRYLAAVPDDQPIWVQYGHALKEQGNIEEAERVYRRAIELRPGDGDAHLQLGHALKLLGKITEAEAAYSAAVERRPRDADSYEQQGYALKAMGRLQAARSAFMAAMELQPSTFLADELTALGRGDAARRLLAATASRDDSDTIYFEIDDLLGYLQAHPTLSGIQRVQAGILEYAIDGRGKQEKYRFVRTDKSGIGFWRLDSADVKAIIDYVREPLVSHDHLRSLIHTAERAATYIIPTRGQTYFVLGAFWGYHVNTGRYAALKRAGLSIGIYIYDLIPVTHPEYCEASLVNDFCFALGDGFHVFDFILTISESTAVEVRKYMSQHALPFVPVAAVPLAHQLRDVSVPFENIGWSSNLEFLKGRRFVLMVSTIEPRKNHAYLYYIWKALLDEGLDPPDLLFVGRFGWLVNDFRDMLRATGFLGGRVHILHDLTDSELSLLYEKCLFTTFPSIVEGWGLPVGESLMHGRPCIASNTSSIPEVGGDLVDYIDPWNLRDGVPVFKKMIFDEAYRAERTAEIHERFVARTWDAVASDLSERIKEFRASYIAQPYRPPEINSGELLVIGDLSSQRSVSEKYFARPLRPILAESWYFPESFGAWLRGDQGSIWFATDCEPGTPITAYFEIVGAPWLGDHSIRITIGKDQQFRDVESSTEESSTMQSKPLSIPSGKNFMCSASGRVDADGSAFIYFELLGDLVLNHPAKNPDDNRIFYIGLTKFGYSANADLQNRVVVLEQLALRNHEM